MTVLVRGLRLGVDHSVDDLRQAVCVSLGIPPTAILHIEPHRRSLDCRGGVAVEYTARVDLDPSDERRLTEAHSDFVTRYTPPALDAPEPGANPLPHPPVVVGAGPAGLFAGFELARLGYRPLLVERGRPIGQRRRDVARFVREGAFDAQSNTVFGEGGAGAFSDGKLTARASDALTQCVLQTLVDHGAPADILVDARPHVGTDRLGPVIERLRESIIAMGGYVRFEAPLDGLDIGPGGLRGVSIAGQPHPATALILAPGSSAEDVFEMLLHGGVALQARPFQLGVRIEHPQAVIDRARYRRHAGHPKLPPADYNVVARTRPEAVFSFCMCPGGEVMYASHEAGRLCTNGMSYHRRAGQFANSALVHTVTPPPGDALSGLALRRRLETQAWQAARGEFRAVAQRASDFVAGRPTRGAVETSYWFDTVAGDVSAYLLEGFARTLAEALKAFDRKLKGFIAEGVLIGLEGRASCPVRIVRGGDGQSVSTPGVYPAGEGAGYAGGIVSSAADGLRAAHAVAARFRLPG